MNPKFKSLEGSQILSIAAKWLFLSLIIGVLSGTASAAFLWCLDFATRWRESHVWIIALLPLSGFALGWIYHTYGKSIETGHQLLLDEIHEPKSVIPGRMAPFIFLGTIATHLFGGSAGREGTAIQMGGSLADQITKPLRVSRHDRRVLLMMGISSGFASVFGTPFAGTVFGLEILLFRKLSYEAFFPCLFASVIGNWVTLSLGIHHTVYSISAIPPLSFTPLFYAAIAGMIFGITGKCFAGSTHVVSREFKNRISYPPLRPFVGGILVALGVYWVGTTQYIGLGIPTIVESFQTKLPIWDFCGKFAFTAITLGSGFKGGEVTPLFYIGATLGNALSYFLYLPMSLLAGLGLVAVFAGAANTPIACTIMAMEIFSPGIGIYAGIACGVSYFFARHGGIYHSRKRGV